MSTPYYTYITTAHENISTTKWFLNSDLKTPL